MPANTEIKMNDKKYELTDETVIENGRTLHRIRALKSFSGVSVGDLGGFIEHEDNLSHDGNAWVGGNAWVSGNAWVGGNSRIGDKARVGGNARVCYDASVGDNALIGDNAWIGDKARVGGNAWVSDYARVRDSAMVGGKARVGGNAWITSICTETPVVISGLTYTITFMDTHISVGCKTFTIDEWMNFSNDEILKMDGKKALNFYPELKLLISEVLSLRD